MQGNACKVLNVMSSTLLVHNQYYLLLLLLLLTFYIIQSAVFDGHLFIAPPQDSLEDWSSLIFVSLLPRKFWNQVGTSNIC